MPSTGPQDDAQLSARRFVDEIAAACGTVLDLGVVELCRYGPSDEADCIARWPTTDAARLSADAAALCRRISAAPRPVRVADRAAAAPVFRAEVLWGALVGTCRPGTSLDEGCEVGLGAFARLLEAEPAGSREVRSVDDGHEGLRRLALLVGERARIEDVLSALCDEVGRLLDVPLVEALRFEEDGTATVVGLHGDHAFDVGENWPMTGTSVTTEVARTAAPARIDDYSGLEGTMASAARAAGARSAVGAPIVVDGRTWGTVIAITDRRQPLPPGTEERLLAFTELAGVTVASVQAAHERRGLLDEQGALRRVATLVARGTAPAEVFSAVALEVSHVLDLPLCTVSRFGKEATAVVVGAAGAHPHAPGRVLMLDDDSASAIVRRGGRPARVDGARWISASGEGGDIPLMVGGTAAAPIVVDGDVWGAIAVGTPAPLPLPAGVEHALTQFTELVAVAVSNAQASADLRDLAAEHAALRRVAVLVANGATEAEVFSTVCEEAARLLDATTANLVRWTEGVRVTVAGWSLRGVHVAPGTRLSIDHATLDGRVYGTASPARVDDYADEQGEVAAILRANGIRSQVAAPVMVDGAVWGVLIVGVDRSDPLPAGTEDRLAEFAELTATAVSNAASRTELVASRARIVEAADEQRRRVVRDLHDGAQQRLVHAVMTLQRLNVDDSGNARGRSLVAAALEDVSGAIVDLRELALGIHPSILTNRGLVAAVEALADRAPIPVEIAVAEQRFAPSVESAAYFVAAEALTNVAKYAAATKARVEVEPSAEGLVVRIADDGRGGARIEPGRGLSGLIDRMAALNGRLVVDSEPGCGTVVEATIPL